MANIKSTNTEDSNEWLDGILGLVVQYQKNQSKLKKLPELDPTQAKQQILSYIQSNYILKSDVEKIIGEDEPISYGDGQIGNTPEEDRNELRQEQRYRLKESSK